MSTVPELKKLAKSKGIVGYSTMRKHELLKVLGKSPKRSVAKRSPKRSASRRGTPYHTIKLTFYYVRLGDKEDGPDPSNAEITAFIQKHAVNAFKKEMTYSGYSVKPHDYKLSGKTLTFKIPGHASAKNFAKFVRDIPLEDGAYSGAIGKGFVVESNLRPGYVVGVIDFRKKVQVVN